MLLRLEIRCKLAGFWSSRVGFLRRGVTIANLYLLGDTLTERDIGEPGNEIRENRDTGLNYTQIGTDTSTSLWLKEKLSDFDEILYTTAHLELDDSHATKRNFFLLQDSGRPAHWQVE